MVAVLGLLAGVLKMVFAARAQAAERGPSLRQARKLAKKMAELLEHDLSSGEERRRKILDALIAQGVAEPVARVVIEEAAQRFSLAGKGGH